MKHINWIFFCMLSCFSLSGQNYWQENIESVETDGYYHIEASQELYGLGLHTLRVTDENGKEIPGFIRSSFSTREMKQVEMYDILYDSKQDSVNTLVLYNKGEKVSCFYLQMKRAEARKYISVRGSYDNKQWFSVKERSLLSELNTDMNGFALIEFPEGDYTYYELTIVNSGISPLDITGVGKIEKSQVYGQFVELEIGRYVVEQDEEGNTVLTFPDMQYPYYLAKLELEITGKGHYRRKAQIIRKELVIESLELSSREDALFYFNELFIDKDTRLVIRNQNNPALKVGELRFWGLKRYMCAYLEGGVPYTIDTHGERNRRYDIQEFSNDIGWDLPVLHTYNLEKISVPVTERELRFFEKPFFMWGIILVIGVTLSWLCMRILKEQKKSSAQ